MFKLVKGKDGTTSFFPIDDKTGGKISYIQNKDAMCRSNILFNRTNIFRDKTSFCQFLTWLSSWSSDQEEAMLETGKSLSYL